jgi:hypothetical protein
MESFQTRNNLDFEDFSLMKYDAVNICVQVQEPAAAIIEVEFL